MAKHPSKSQLRAIAEYVADLKENMRLCNWRLRVSRGRPPFDNADATVWIRDDHHEAEIRVDWPRFRALSRAEQRHTLVHELCHLILDPYSTQVHRHLEPKGRGGRTRRAVAADLDGVLELVNDDFAYVIAQGQPLPRRGWLDG